MRSPSGEPALLTLSPWPACGGALMVSAGVMLDAKRPSGFLQVLHLLQGCTSPVAGVARLTSTHRPGHPCNRRCV